MLDNAPLPSGRCDGRPRCAADPACAWPVEPGMLTCPHHLRMRLVQPAWLPEPDRPVQPPPAWQAWRPSAARAGRRSGLTQCAHGHCTEPAWLHLLCIAHRKAYNTYWRNGGGWPPLRWAVWHSKRFGVQ